MNIIGIINEEIENLNKVFYHGRNEGSRPYYGNYIFITSSLGYASGYSRNKIMKYLIPFSSSKIFSINDSNDLKNLSKYVDQQTISAIIRDSGKGNEIDWGALSYLGTDQYESPEDLLEHMGYYGVKLKEREGVESILIFDQNKLKYKGRGDLGFS